MAHTVRNRRKRRRRKKCGGDEQKTWRGTLGQTGSRGALGHQLPNRKLMQVAEKIKRRTRIRVRLPLVGEIPDLKAGRRQGRKGT